MEYRTSWAKISPPYGAFDDYVIVESLINHHRFYFRPEEFECLMNKILSIWREGKINYLQILKEWNEVTGFNGIQEIPSKIENPNGFIKSLELITVTDFMEFGEITNEDLNQFFNFLNSYKDEILMIMKE